jgi:hypothetical protein
VKKPQDLAAEVRAYCVANQDLKEAERYARFFTEGYDAWGLHKDHPIWTEKERDWLERYAVLGPAGFLKAGEILLASGKYEEGSMAIRFVLRHLESFDAGLVASLEKYFRAGICNWAHTDVLCGQVIAPMLANGRIELASLDPWRASELKFQRRAVPVAMLGLLGSKTAIGGLLDFLRPLMLDGERVVQQGLGWFLREAWKKQPKPVEKFLLEWRNQAPRLIFQYATEKMTPTERERFRREKAPARKKPAAGTR